MKTSGVASHGELRVMSCDDCNDEENEPSEGSMKDSTLMKRKAENDRKDEVQEDDLNCWRYLPSGAEHIIQSLAAEELLFLLLNRFGQAARVDFRAIRSLVTRFPSTCHRSYRFDWYQGQTRHLTPLAVLSCFKPPLTLLEIVYQNNPSAIHISEPSTTAIPLDYACSYEAPLEVVQFLVKHSSSLALQTPRHERFLPLHLACHFAATLEVVQFLYEEFPGAMEHGESEGWLPLHAAVAGRAPFSVVEFLAKVHPEAALARDSGHSTPLHIACSTNSTDQAVQVVEFLMRRAPQTLGLRDIDTLTPLFRAVRNHSLPIVRGMLEFSRELEDSVPMVTVDPLGGTLLHHAAGHNHHSRRHRTRTLDDDYGLYEDDRNDDNNDEESHEGEDDGSLVVQYLIQQFPEFVWSRTADPDQFLPLHVACLFASPLAVVKCLVSAAPETLLAKDGQGRTPLALIETAVMAEPAKYRSVRQWLREQQTIATTTT